MFDATSNPNILEILNNIDGKITTITISNNRNIQKLPYRIDNFLFFNVLMINNN